MSNGLEVFNKNGELVYSHEIQPIGVYATLQKTGDKGELIYPKYIPNSKLLIIAYAPYMFGWADQVSANIYKLPIVQEVNSDKWDGSFSVELTAGVGRFYKWAKTYVDVIKSTDIRLSWYTEFFNGENERITNTQYGNYLKFIVYIMARG